MHRDLLLIITTIDLALSGASLFLNTEIRYKKIKGLERTMKRQQQFCLTVAIIAIMCVANTYAFQVSTPVSGDEWGPFAHLKNVVELKIGDPNNVEGHWEMGIRKRHHGFFPMEKVTDFPWINADDPNTWYDEAEAQGAAAPEGQPIATGSSNKNDMQPFTLEFIQATGEVIFTLGWPNHKWERQVTYQYEDYAGRGMDEIYVMASKGNSCKSSVHELELKVGTDNYEPVISELTGQGKNTYIAISGLACMDYTLKGYIKFGWAQPVLHADIEAVFAFGEPCGAEFWSIEGDVRTAQFDPDVLPEPWVLKFISKSSETPMSGSLICDLPANISFSSISDLSADYALSDAGVIEGTSPRFSMTLDINDNGIIDPNDETVSVHWVVLDERITATPYDWFNTGNLYDSNDLRVDLSQVGGEFFSTIDDAKTQIGEKNVLRVSLIVEGYEPIYVDNVKIDAYVYSPGPPFFIGDFNDDHQVGATDLRMLADNWLTMDCLPDPNTCQKTDIAPVELPDGKVNLQDIALFAENWLLGTEEDPPNPYFMEFAVVPTAIDAYSITMTAVTASDESGVEYYFNNVTVPFHDSGWQPSSTYVDTDLYPDAVYVYRVKARDVSQLKNENVYSDPNSARTEYADVWPPSPNPPTWVSVPTAVDSHTVAMEVGVASDTSGVEYYFYNEIDPNHSSGWQDSTVYVDTGLQEETRYQYIVLARDKSLNLNMTIPSVRKSVDTPVGEDLYPPIPNPMTWQVLPEATGENSIIMTAALATDRPTTGVEYFFEVSDSNGLVDTSDWQASRVYEDTDLQVDTLYTYRVKARDKSPNQNETDYSDPASATTLPDSTSPQPVTWDLPPRTIGSHTVIMTSAIATDAAGVQYYFHNATDPTHDSGWQDSEFYEDAGLDPNTEYTYQIKARDKFPGQFNETEYSEIALVTTALEGAVQTLVLLSMPEYDGRIWGTNAGGLFYNGFQTTPRSLRLGGVPDFGYRSQVSFDTTRLMPTKLPQLIIVAANLELTCGLHAIVSDDPFSWGGACRVDLDSAFAGDPDLSVLDWDYPGEVTGAAFFNRTSAPAINEAMTSTDFTQQGKDYIDRNGITQMRVLFNNVKHSTASYVGFYSGEWSEKEPKLIIQYTD
jgi:hypothetical protein